jgi:hypothetical protein
MKPFAKLSPTIVEMHSVIMSLQFCRLSLVPMSLARLIPYLALSIKRRRERLNKSHKQLADETGFSPKLVAPTFR